MAGNISKPSVTVQLLPSAVIQAFADRNDLIVGQLGTTATATGGALNSNVETLSDTEIATLFGNDELYHRILNWKAGNGGYSPLSVIGVDGVVGTFASQALAFSGAATADGTLSISIIDEEEFTLTISVTSGDDNDAVGDLVVAAVAALGTLPPFSAANATGTVTFTAADSGTIGNYYSSKISGTIAGLTYVLNPWSSGATDPTITGIFDVIDGLRFTSISWPESWQGNIDEVTDLLDARFNPSNDVLDGCAFTGHSDTYANDLTFVGTLNSQSLVVGGNNKLASAYHKGSAIVQPADWTMTYFMGVESKMLTTGAPISSNIVATNAPLDAIGGPHNASLPKFNTPLAQVPVTASTNQFSDTEQGALNDAGFSVFGVNTAGNTMLMGTVVTTRTTDAAGNVNDSFRYFNYVRTGSVCREIFFRTLKATFSQSRLAEGIARPGYSVANEETIRAELGSIYKSLSDIVLVEAGDVAEQYFAANTTVTISKSTRSVTITSLLPIVTQLETINYPLALSFTIGTA